MVKKCKAEHGIRGSRYPIKCPFVALPNEDYCPLHLALVKRMEMRHKKMWRIK